ncbi:MAG: sensor domain-containing protein, partial [Jatrophihabitantaceae bacterium]
MPQLDEPGGGVEVAAGPLPAYLDGLINFGGVMSVRGEADGRYLLANPAFELLVGRPSTAIVGRTPYDLFPAAVADQVVAADQAVLRWGIARTQPETMPNSFGEPRHFVVHTFPLFDPDGNRFAIGSIAVDVTSIEHEVEQQREAQIDSEARFRAVFDHAPIGQIFSSMDGLVTSVNEPMAAMLGYRPHEMLNHSVREYAPPAEYARIKIATERLLRNETLSMSEVRRFIHRLGHEVPVRVTSALLRDQHDEPRWWVSMVVDISGEERARAELEKAHDAALLSADRLRLLHSIATAANEASGLGVLAPRVLSTVCGQFGWRSAALVRWDGPMPEVVAAYGEACELPDSGHGGGDEDGASTTMIDDRTVCVRLPVPASGSAALLFTLPANTELDGDQREVLSLVGIETARVLERESAEQRLRDSEERFRSVFDSSPLAMALTLGDTGTFHAVNGALCALMGRRADELIGRSATDLCHPDDVHLTDPAGAAAMAAPDGRHRFELRWLHSSGTVVTTMVTLAWMDGPDGRRQLLAQMEDITARRTVEEVLRRQAEQDGLTGLANRTLLGRMLGELGEAGRPCAILFIDLDGFKLINDTRGHDVGDEVLLEVASRLRTAVRPSDVVARFGGDEFVVVCDGGSSGNELAMARRVADRIEHALRRPIVTEDGPTSVTASIGIAGGLVDFRSPQELVQRADAAMYQAKRLGKDRQEVYDDHLHERALDHQRTEAALRNALDDERFVVHYQPIVDLENLEITGFEALVRLEDELGGLVAPGKFIAVAEQSGLIVPMGTWVLADSCRTIAWVREQTGRPITVSVNIAARQAARTDFAATVLAALEESGLPESALMLELTESALLEADESTLAQLVDLRARGVRIALDD